MRVLVKCSFIERKKVEVEERIRAAVERYEDYSFSNTFILLTGL